MAESNGESKPVVSVLFVCLGNICRSTMAEGVFRSLVSSSPTSSRSLIDTIDSAGTGAYHTLNPPDYRTMQTLRKNGITDYDHGARQVSLSDFDEFDYIFAMDGMNLRDLEKLKKKAESKKGKQGNGEQLRAKVMLYGNFAGEGGKRRAEEVVDPYYGANNGFDVVFEQVDRFGKNFLKEIVGSKS